MDQQYTLACPHCGSARSVHERRDPDRSNYTGEDVWFCYECHRGFEEPIKRETQYRFDHLEDYQFKPGHDPGQGSAYTEDDLPNGLTADMAEAIRKQREQADPEAEVAE